MLSILQIGTACIIAAAYVLFRVAYRLWLHPLSHFPGPKIAASTFWYQFYHDAIRQGQYMFKIREMHAKYGPIVRITPDELHFNEASFIPIVYAASTKRRDKWRRWIRVIGNAVDQSLVSSAGHDGHRLRRAPLNQFFSKTRVRQLEPVLQRNLEKLLSRLEEHQHDAAPIDLHALHGAYTQDLITKYSFGEVHSTNWLEDPRHFTRFRQHMHSAHVLLPWLTQLYWLFDLMNWIPASLLKMVDEGTLLRVQMQQLYEDLIKKTKAKHAVNGNVKPAEAVSIIDALLDSDLPERELAHKRLQIEAEIIVIAGTGTTAWALASATLHLLDNPLVLQRLRRALEDAIPDVSVGFSLTQVEQIPYLTAVIQEAIRISTPVTTRSPRISPHEALALNDGDKTWVIPPGTPISTSSPFINFDPKIFPSPHDFVPERWLQNAHLDRYLFSFSKGSRQCIGMNLAYAELYMVLAGMFRRYGARDDPGPEGWMELYQTGKEDVTLGRDLFEAYPRVGRNGVRVVVHGPENE